MPDSDKIGKLSRRWSKMYKKVCEGHFDSAELANDAMSPLVKDIKDYGDAPIRFLKQASVRLEGIQNNPLFRSVHNWNDEDDFIRKLASTYMQKGRANQRGINIAILVFKGLIHKLRNNEVITENFYEVLCHNYIRRIYDSNFSERIPVAGENYTNLAEDVDRKLSEISNFVDKNISSLAYRIAQKGNVRRLSSITRRLPRKTITLEEDVFKIGRSI